MRIAVVTVSSGWILQKIAERIVAANRTGHDLFVCYAPRDDVDANFYVDAQNCFFRKSRARDILFFTHADRNDTRTINPIVRDADFIFHQCSRYLLMFSEFYPAHRMEVMYPAPDSMFKPRKIRIGIFQRGEYVGKGTQFLVRASDNEILQKFEFLFVGKGWRQVAEIMRNKGISVEVRDEECHDRYPELYRSVDCVLVPSLWEGGCMSIIETLAQGIPLISADVGWANIDFKPDMSFTPNDVDGLVSILKTLNYAVERRTKQVQGLSYERCAEQLVNIVGSLM